MIRCSGAVLVAVFLTVFGESRADEAEARAVVEKAIKALGGDEKLAKAEMATWKGQGKMTINDNTNEFKTKVTVKGLTHFRSEFEGKFNGSEIKVMTVLAGDRGWRKFGENIDDLDAPMLVNQKRAAYLQIIPVTLLPLKGKGFKLESASDEKVGGKPASVVKVTGPDGNDFKLLFDKETNLLLKMVATINAFGDEFTQETTFTDYKDFAGFKKATTIVSTRDGEKFIDQTITDFKLIDKVDEGIFAEPK